MKEVDGPDSGQKSESMQLDEGERCDPRVSSDSTSDEKMGMATDQDPVAHTDGGGQHGSSSAGDQIATSAIASDIDADGDGEFFEADPDSAENDVPSNGNRKRRHRRGKQKGGTHHRKWKPYTKMTWEERRELDERETKRACMKREERFASGHPVAPYNTTQFLMDDHKQVLHIEHRRDSETVNPGLSDDSAPQSICQGEGAGSLDMDSSEEFYDSPNGEELFMEKEFTETYDNIHAERLHTMSKNELIRELMDLETKLEKHEKKSQLPTEGETGRSLNNNTTNHNKDRVQIVEKTNEGLKLKTLTNLQNEIKLLRDENEKLRTENELLRFASKRCKTMN